MNPDNGYKQGDSFMGGMNLLIDEAFVRLPKESREAKTGKINEAFQALSTSLGTHEGIVFGEHEQAMLQLKLVRYFQRMESIDIPTVRDALVETPGFLAREKRRFSWDCLAKATMNVYIEAVSKK